MLKQERFAKIVESLGENNTLKTEEIAKILDVSMATARRDINELAESKKIKKIFGGAQALRDVNYVTTEERMDEKLKINIAEKLAIGKFAANLIKDNDLVYMDAGSSVESMITFIKGNNIREVTFVTNSIYIAREISALKYKVFILPGEIKLSTDSIVGVSAMQYLSRFNFTIGFFGVNGIHKDFGFTTPDINEAMVKEEAMKKCKKAYILADSSKFDKVSQVSFGKSVDCEIITEVPDSEGYKAKIVRL